ncbi:LysM peptidoglycan-binding domain-containing protein [Pontiella agarivorans]|uniref:LysM peptidoglycan-binding domain-containing protein n=1 Tax=Pontiella agarivorans TaxID=3038953 RepID=A0ABU5MU18_9BACT|nr:LysM peptidoglycan-binding domain-containing protein [Pontiella agarivorans]MDZ8117586.1 LysM peptidoglycan-binding domain-containing protein [Pontiella agarivorans]
MNRFIPMLLVGVMTLAGCGKNSGSIEEREERDPNVLSGQQYMEQGNYDAAIQEFKTALEQEPLMARPHLDLAIIYQQHKINYIHAIYHYDRYLELRPNAEKAGFIEEQKLKVAQALANTLVNNSPEVKKVIQQRSTLIQQNNDLKRQLADALKKKSVAPVTTTPTTASQTVTPKRNTESVTQAVPKPTTSIVPAGTTQVPTKPKHQIYHVVGGDTLTKIATKFYGDSGKWDIIYEANKGMMRSPGDLRVGQTLVIPSIQN